MDTPSKQVLLQKIIDLQSDVLDYMDDLESAKAAYEALDAENQALEDQLQTLLASETLQ
ncbi:hypothetical protein H4R35_000294 [Dimargaris xerosporica]|nr:hypothetical protein H4R35_000294 [Dimargaris xerosporica]